MPMNIDATVVGCLVVRSKRTTERVCWHAASRLPSFDAASPLHPTSEMNLSHAPSGVYLMMSPPLADPATKFVKKNACWLATQVGPSFHVYRRSKFSQTFFVETTIGAGNGPG